MDKKVVLTGSSSGIGRAIAQLLEANGYHIIPFNSRLEDTQSIEKEAKEILASHDIDVLINSAGFGMFEPHEELNPSNIAKQIGRASCRERV